MFPFLKKNFQLSKLRTIIWRRARYVGACIDKLTYVTEIIYPEGRVFCAYVYYLTCQDMSREKFKIEDKSVSLIQTIFNTLQLSPVITAIDERQKTLMHNYCSRCQVTDVGLTLPAFQNRYC